MSRNYLHWALASVAVVLLCASASAQSSQGAAPGKTNAAPAAQHAGDKPKGDKQDDKGAVDAKDAKGKSVDSTAKDVDRAARLKTQHDAEAAQLRTALQAPMTEGQKQELRRHAQRVAKLQRIRDLATDAKDQATVDRANKLLDKEEARYQKWLASLSTRTDTSAVNPNAANQAKAGAQ